MNYVTIILISAPIILIAVYLNEIYKERASTKQRIEMMSKKRIESVAAHIERMKAGNVSIDEFTDKIVLLGNALKEGASIDENFFSNRNI